MFTGWKRTVAVVAAALAVGLLGVGLTTAAKPKPPTPPPQVSYDVVWIEGVGGGLPHKQLWRTRSRGALPELHQPFGPARHG